MFYLHLLRKRFSLKGNLTCTSTLAGCDWHIQYSVLCIRLDAHYSSQKGKSNLFSKTIKNHEFMRVCVLKTCVHAQSLWCMKTIVVHVAVFMSFCDYHSHGLFHATQFTPDDWAAVTMAVCSWHSGRASCGISAEEDWWQFHCDSRQVKKDASSLATACGVRLLVLRLQLRIDLMHSAHCCVKWCMKLQETHLIS